MMMHVVHHQFVLFLLWFVLFLGGRVEEGERRRQGGKHVVSVIEYERKINKKQKTYWAQTMICVSPPCL
jgi:hypothetical protein